jgi:DNA repair exonuclease SbcCD ATPase subunit
MSLTTAEKSARYRAKDVEAYRAMKRALAKTEKHRAKRREYMQRWREENRERHNQLARESHQRNKHKHIQRNREYHLMSTYGVTQAEYDKMLVAQEGRCRICGTDKPTGHSKRFFSVDHDHKTGRVRGLLCHTCNTQLGWFENNTVAVMNYLRTA